MRCAAADAVCLGPSEWACGPSRRGLSTSPQQHRSRGQDDLGARHLADHVPTEEQVEGPLEEEKVLLHGRGETSPQTSRTGARRRVDGSRRRDAERMVTRTGPHMMDDERWSYVSKVWFITGASKGFGREWALAALERGDQVAATARKPETLSALVDQYGDNVLALTLDVTDRAADQAAVKQAAERFGRLDVVINNAGYGHFGMVEELTEAELRGQLETNLFGAVWVTQAALPIMREQGSGHIIQVSSIGGISAFPTVGAYHASKWALEGLSQSLSQEVSGFGIHVTLIEPGGYSTDWSGPSAVHSVENPAYADIREAAKSRPSAANPGDPTATREPILKVVDADPPPLRVFFGAAPLGIATKDYESRLATWNEWQPVSLQAHGSRGV